MQRRSTLLAVLIIAVVLFTACPKKQPPPQPPQPPQQTDTVEPPTATVTETVAPPSSDFPETEEPGEVLSEDIGELNKQAQGNGWIRDAMFGYDEATLDADAQAALTASATWLRAHPELHLRIEGHCDERGTEQYNLALGDRRAAAAGSYLQTLGIDASRITLLSYGEEKPFAIGTDDEAWAMNRRAHLVLVRP